MQQKSFIKILTLIICLFLAINLVACNKEIPKTIGVPLPGWIVIKGEGVTLFLPQSFVGGNPGRDLDKITEQLKAIDPSYEQKILGITQNPTAIALLAFDTQNNKDLANNNSSSTTNIPTLTNINITSQVIPKDATMISLVEQSSQQIAKSYQLSEHKVINIKQGEIGQIIAMIPNVNPPIKQLFYLVPSVDQKKVWLVTYTTTSKEFDRLLPMFRESIETLQILA